jgi:hypothetical protein
MERVKKILEQAEQTGNRKLARKLRLDVLESMMEFEKTAQSMQSGIFQVFRDGVVDYPTRENATTERGGKAEKDLYNLEPEGKKMDSKRRPHDRSLSTRYSPDRVGVQARRIADGVYQDPYTNKLYNWNDGFKTEDGQSFGGGSVQLQTDLVHNK